VIEVQRKNFLVLGNEVSKVQSILGLWRHCIIVDELSHKHFGLRLQRKNGDELTIEDLCLLMNKLLNFVDTDVYHQSGYPHCQIEVVTSSELELHLIGQNEWFV
jgi:hypothetical protein